MRDDLRLVTVTFSCRCAATIRASGVPALGMLTLRHGDDPRPLGLFDDPLIARVLAGDPAVLREPKVRAWLRGYHPEP
jgi:hypothetical protein